MMRATAAKPARTLPFGIQLPEWNVLYFGYALFLISIITYRFPVGTVGLVLGIVGLLMAGSTMRIPLPGLCMAGLLLIAAAGVSGSYDPSIAWDAVVVCFKTWIIALVGYNALRTPRQVNFVLLFFLLLYAFVPVRPALFGYVAGVTHAGRAVGPFTYSNSNDLAAITLLAIGVTLSVLVLARRHKVIRLCAFGFLGVLVILELLTQSRGGFIGLLAMMVPLVIASAKKGIRIIVLAVALIIVAVLTVPSSAWTRFRGIEKLSSVETIDEADPEGSAADRFKVVQAAIRIIGDYPILGVGLGNYPLANQKYSEKHRKSDTHNTYLNVAAETGIPGFVLFVVAVISIFRYSSNARRELKKTQPDRAVALGHLQRGLAGFMAAAFFGSYAWLGIFHVYLALVWSVAMVWTAKPRAVVAPRRNPQGTRGLWEPHFESPPAS